MRKPKYIYQTVMGTETESDVADDRLLTDSAGKYLLAARRHNQVRRGQLEEALFGPQMLT